MKTDLSRLLAEAEKAHAKLSALASEWDADWSGGNVRSYFAVGEDLADAVRDLPLPTLLAELRRQDEALAAVGGVVAFLDDAAEGRSPSAAAIYRDIADRLRAVLAAHSEQPEEAR